MIQRHISEREKIIKEGTIIIIIILISKFCFVYRQSGLVQHNGVV